VLTKAKKRKTVLIITLNPSLERSLVDMIDAIDPNKIEPTIEAKIRNGIVSKLNWTDLKNNG
jgi:predicted nucleotidyltransferase